jgi:phytoene desaturase
MNNPKNKIAIIGAGIAGLACAIRLAHAGNEVSIFETNTYPGGKLNEFVQGGYRFDAGPSLFTLPNLVMELLQLAEMNNEDDFPFIKLEKGCHYFYEDGTRLIAYQNQNDFAKEIENKLGVDPKTVSNYFKNAKNNYEKTSPLFIESSLHRIETYTSKKTIKGLFAMPNLGLFESMNHQNERKLKEPHLIQYFNRFATYNGSNPYQAPAVLNMIPHLEHGIGTYFPKYGMIQITNALVKSCEKLFVKINYNSKVERIKIENKQVIGIEINGKLQSFDTIISNMDIYPTYRKLLEDQPAPEYLLKQEKSSSAIIFYWGIKKEFQELDLHNILFSANYKEEFDCLFNGKTLYDDPTVYINISKKYLKSDAPEGCENWFVMVNAPSNNVQNWDQIIETTKHNIIKKINRILRTDIANYIENESVLDPRLIEQKTSSFGGSLYGNASNNKYAAFLRHANFSNKIKGLYFCGGSVHPGGGIPLCLNSGKIVSDLIQKKQKKLK